VAFDIHKKLLVGALGCGVFFILGFLALFLIGRRGVTPTAGEPEMLMLGQAAQSWDSISAASGRDVLTMPEVPTWTGPPRAAGYLRILPSLNGDELPAFADTFPAGSPEQKGVVRTAQRVMVEDASTPTRTAGLPYPPPFVVFYRARIFFAAADDWSRHGDLSEAALALDSALALARVSLRTSDLDRVLAGARIERDALDLLSRDTLLAGGVTGAKQAAQALEAWARLAKQVEAADHWMMAAGSSNLYDDSLARVAADSTLPVLWRAAAAEAVAMGWVFNSGEAGQGVTEGRRATLKRLRESHLPDSVNAVIDRAAAIGNVGFMDRLKAMANYRAQRELLFRP